ncbi:NgoFVII family restriction endonuclease [Flagellimonas alvinocaridis]|uniref:NgoFVII family restriction endonuclease n=1 Tax=Flagellimonas alvinocaridis TaxID=2530200 RepID=A0A4S8RS82_9FLAO|nr:phospholipase D-like domain-containing protein [Allomuricauda alvinocaridis]THV60832.1 NgoFVII family restriction endonuclease [Allomuricauda alvinocaridis]
MSVVVTSLKDGLIQELQSADEIWIGVALMTNSAFNLIQRYISAEVRQHYLLGISLPTEPQVLRKLYKLEAKPNIGTRLYVEREFYHPKVYIIRRVKSYAAFIGSANCTTSGLSKNIEVSYKITNTKDCKELIGWFNTLNENSLSLSSKFIDTYEKRFQKRLDRKREDEREVHELKAKIQQEHVATMKARAELLEVLKWHRRQPEYDEVKRKRKRNVSELREALGYPSYENINVDAFFGIWDLGHLIAIAIPPIKREKNKFRNILTYLSDDTIDISERVDRVLSGDLKMRGVGEATVSKILTIHDPKKYAVRNDRIDSLLVSYGIETPRGISKGARYKAINTFLNHICKESGMNNLAVLDYYLYLEATEE